MKNKLKKNQFEVLTLIWTVIIVMLAIIPISGFWASSFHRYKDLAHFLQYFIFSLLLYKIFVRRVIFLQALFAVFLVSSTFSVLTEFLQLFVEVRRFSLIDIIVNLSGVLSGIILIIILKLRKHTNDLK